MKFGPTSCAHPNNTLASRYASIYLRCRSIFRLIDCCVTRLHEKRCLGNKETRQTTRRGISSAFDDVVSTRDRPNAEGFTRHANQRSSIVCRFLFFHFLRCKQVVKSVSYQRVHISRERKAHEGKRIDREMRKGRFETLIHGAVENGRLMSHWCYQYQGYLNWNSLESEDENFIYFGGKRQILVCWRTVGHLKDRTFNIYFRRNLKSPCWHFRGYGIEAYRGQARLFR